MTDRERTFRDGVRAFLAEIGQAGVVLIRAAVIILVAGGLCGIEVGRLHARLCRHVARRWNRGLVAFGLRHGRGRNGRV